jgi:hypothetical protein
MYRALFELLVTVFIIVIARSLLTSLLKGIATASKSFQAGPDQGPNGDSGAGSATGQKRSPSQNELHRDPVCGTYVTESTPYQRRSSSQVFYYCSTDCREKHALVAR